MIEDGRADDGLTELENGIKKLIKYVNGFRGELPKPKMKKLRKYLENVKKGRNRTLPIFRKEQLITALEVTVKILNEAKDGSRSGKLAEAHGYALNLLIKFF